MATKTISEIAAITGIATRTIRSATSAALKDAAKQSGSTWLIDDESEAYKAWLAAHWQQSRVKGKTK